MICCIDSQIAIWGMKKQSSSTQVEMIDRAERFFAHATTNKIDIVIPTAVITEILSVEPIEKHAEYLQIIQKGFIIGDHDIRVAKKAAELMHDNVTSFKEYLEDNNLVRDRMKFDHVIAATAIIYQADYMYTQDGHIRTICKNIIPVGKMPDIPISKPSNIMQMDAFGGEMKVISIKKR